MDENILTTEVTETEVAGFDEAWADAEAVEETAAEEEVTEAEETADTDAGDQRETAAEEAGEPQNTEGAATDDQGEGGNQTFTLKHLGQESTVGREEVIALAQKGMDYDRQVEGHRQFTDAVDALGGLERLDGYVKFLHELAASGGTDIDGVIEQTRASILAKSENIDYNAALERVRLKQKEEALEAREKRVNAGEQKQREADEAAEKRASDFAEFIRVYPGVDAAKIPAEVWDAVAKGESLVSAWARHDAAELREENKRLAARIEAIEKNAENREKAAGSQKSAGAKNAAADPFDDGWDTD